MIAGITSILRFWIGQRAKWFDNFLWSVDGRLFSSFVEERETKESFVSNIKVFLQMSSWQELVFIHSVQFSRLVVSDSLWPHGLQHSRPPCPSPTARVYSNSCPLSPWCHPTISSSVGPFSCLQSLPASGSFRMSQFLTSGGQITGVSALASVFPMIIQDWFPLGWTGSTSLQSKGLSRVFSNTTVQKHQFFDVHDYWENYSFD